MTRKKQTRGTCAFCGREMTRGGMSRHLQSCPERQKVQEATGQPRVRPKTLYHLQVADAYGGDFWLQLEIGGDATLKDLDSYLRAIWLECCGHLSAFRIGRWRYTQIFEDGWIIGDEKPLSTRVEQLFAPGVEIPYQYDFGSTTDLVIKVVDERQGLPLTRNPIALMARNHQPEVACNECDSPATWLCMECIYEYDMPGLLCDAHAEEHPHYDYGGPIPFVNSPRVGVCGYAGPAEPPY